MAYRKFRKNWLDGAIIGLKSEGPSKSSNWPSDVECDNGVIQAIDTVLVPGAFDKPAVFAVWPVAGSMNGFGGIGRLVVAPRASTQLQASITETLATLNGPEIFWGSDGVALGHEEADIKGYDNFDQLAAALSKEGIDLSGGEYTLLAPANSAFDKHNNEVGTPITADVLKYHVIEGKKTMDALNTDQKTLNGGTLTAYRKFRKNWLDGAIIGLKSEGPSKSSNWPSDVECDNGIIQAIDTVLVPGAYENPAAFAVWSVAGGIGRLVKAYDNPAAFTVALTQLQASITETLATLEGPEIFWGSDGVALGHEEADIKGYDNFDQLAAALSKEGIDLSGGEYTLLAPANSAFDKHN